MQLLEANVRASGLSHVCSVQELPWGQASWDSTLAPFDAVLAADVVYREDSAALLAETIACAIPVGSSAPFLLGTAPLTTARSLRRVVLQSPGVPLTYCAGFTNRIIGADVFFDGM
jgi:hypothetical protein